MCWLDAIEEGSQDVAHGLAHAAYVAALQRAMEELVVENGEFEDLITGLFEESVEELYGGQ